MEFLAALAAAVTLAIPGRTNATPSIAARGDVVVVVWGATVPSGQTDIFSAVSRDGARTFAQPVLVNSSPGDARVNGEQPPRVLFAMRANESSPAIVVVWTTKGSSGTKLVWSQSIDGGRTFASSATVPGSDAAGNRGWHSVAAATGNRPLAVWLDHRAMADHSMAGNHHQHGDDPAARKAASEKPDGVAMAQLSKLYVASLDGTVAAHAVTPGVCYCCKTATVAAADGSIYAAWRHVYAGNMRDIAFAVSRDRGRTFSEPVRISEDKWMIEGCPDDGPAMAVDTDHRVHVVWPTVITDEKTAEPAKAIFYVTSTDGRRFSSRVRVPTTGNANHPQIVLDGGRPVLAWDEVANGERRTVIAKSTNGRTGPVFERVVVSEGSPAVYPALAATDRAVVAAWTAGGAGNSTIRVLILNTGH